MSSNEEAPKPYAGSDPRGQIFPQQQGYYTALEQYNTTGDKSALNNYAPGGPGGAPEGSKKGSAAPPDYIAAAEMTAQQNRPTLNTPFAGQQWTTGPDGKPMLTTGFSGQMGELNTALQQQASSAMGKPLDFSTLPQLNYGEDARKAAEEAAYGQATSRLDPMFAKREAALRTRLLNQGLDPSSEAARNASGDFETVRTDAYKSAQNAAVSQGMAAQQQAYGQSFAARQQALAEALRQRGMPLQELQAMQGFLAMPGYSSASGVDYLQAAGLQDGAERARTAEQQQLWSDIIGALSEGTGAMVGAMSDEEAKFELERLPVEVVEGVPLATWRYKPEYGDSSKRYFGVVAQDLEAARPGYVTTGEDGLKRVNYDALREEVANAGE